MPVPPPRPAPRWLLGVAVGLAAATAAQAAEGPPAAPKIDRLEVGRALPRADLLKPGVRRYARYLVSGEGRALIDLWTRRVSYEDAGGRRVLRIRQRWDAADKSYVATFDQTFEAGTFRPLGQTQTVTRGGATKVLSVTLDGARVDSTSDAQPNAKPIHQSFALPFYNWNTDIELLQALPLAKGYAAEIPFYDVGLDPPARYVYAVSGEAAVAGPDGATIPCWLVTFRQTPKDPPVRYWIAKHTQVLVREEAEVTGQGILVKTLLPPEAADAI